MTTGKEAYDLLCKGEVLIDWNGHFRERRVQPTVEAESGRIQGEGRLNKEFELVRAIRFSVSHSVKGEDSLDFMLRYHRSIPCKDCGEECVFEYTEGLLKVKDPCQYPEGYPEYSNTIHIPTGEIVFASELLSKNPKELDSEEESSSILWYKGIADNAAAIDFGHGFCGNASPRVYVREDGKEILVASPAMPIDPLRPHMEGVEQPIEGFTKIGMIITGIWWWTIADLSVAEAKAKEIKASVKPQGNAKVEPGAWKIRYRHHIEDRDNRDIPTMYARLEWQNS